MPIILLENISVSFGDIFALENISLSIKKGDYIGLLGPNGAGKSTLLKTILGTVFPSSGKRNVDSGVQFGYVPQNYLPHHFFSLSVKEIMEMGFDRFHFFRQSSEQKKIEEKLSQVGLSTYLLSHSFHSLSGGQKQRVIIARSLLSDPNVLLFDEPLSGVDYATKIQIYELLADLNTLYGITIIFVSHEIESVVQKCKKVLCLNKTLYDGCHPVVFIQGEKEQCCSMSDVHVLPVYHHHSLLS